MTDVQNALEEWLKDRHPLASDIGAERLEKLLRRVVTLTAEEVARDGWINCDAAILAAIKEEQGGRTED